MATPGESLLCPITLELFRDPVLAQDGHTYEREAIENWIRTEGTSPLTRQELSLEHLYPNHIVKKLVAAFEKSLQQKNYQFILDVDVKKKKGRPLFQTYGKTIYHGEWLPSDSNQPEIILLKIDGARALKEASFYVNLTRHPHVVRTFGFVYDKKNDDENNSVMLIQEYASEGSLHELLQEQDTPLDEKVLIEMFLQIIDAMIFLAYNRVVHADLACRNVLIFRFDETNPKNNIVKVTDFGLSRQSALYSKMMGSAHTALDIVPTRYAAPEILTENSTPDDYTEKSDVYSMGILMWEAYSRGALPWAKVEKDADVIRNVMNSVYLTKPSNCSAKYWDIIIKTWSKLPSDRPNFEELKRLLVERSYLPVVNSSEEQRTSEPRSLAGEVENRKELLPSMIPVSSVMSLLNENQIDTNVEPVIKEKTVDKQNKSLPPTQNRSTRRAVGRTVSLSPKSATTPVSTSPAFMDGKREYIFKVLVLGDTYVGKTALLERYVRNSFSEPSRITTGVDFALKIVKYDDDTDIRLQIWDVNGSERYGDMTRIYFKDAMGCVIVFDVARESSFKAVSIWKTLLDNQVRLPDGKSLPCILLACGKDDLAREAFVNNAQQMDNFCRENGFAKWFEVSARENLNIEASFPFLITEIMKQTKQLRQLTPELNIRPVTIKVNDKSSSKTKSGSNCYGGGSSHH